VRVAVCETELPGRGRNIRFFHLPICRGKVATEDVGERVQRHLETHLAGFDGVHRVDRAVGVVVGHDHLAEAPAGARHGDDDVERLVPRVLDGQTESGVEVGRTGHVGVVGGEAREVGGRGGLA